MQVSEVEPMRGIYIFVLAAATALNKNITAKIPLAHASGRLPLIPNRAGNMTACRSIVCAGRLAPGATLPCQIDNVITSISPKASKYYYWSHYEYPL